MHIDQILEQVRDKQYVPIEPSWGQGRTLFGGITGAVLCQAAGEGVDPDKTLRHFQVEFVRPALAGQPYTVSVEEISNGKTLTSREIRLIQEDKIRVTARADFVRPIESDVRIDTFTAPDLAPKERGTQMTEVGLPDFVSHFDNYVTTAGVPFQGGKVPELGGWMRFKDAPQQIKDPHLVALIDSWPPTASPYYVGFKPVSTVSWSMHFTEHASTVQPGDHLGYLAKVHFGADGVSSSSADIWTPDGRLVAKSLQTNLIFA